jgi:hypothetical protein
MSFEKENFLRTKLVTYLQRLDPGTPSRWGKMSVQAMIEHFTEDALKNANGRLRFDKYAIPADQVSRMHDFMMSEKPFRKNTRNPLMGEEPAPLRHRTVQAAIGALQEELIHFFDVYEKNPSLVLRNPFFGDLNFEQNVQLLYKHAIHHLNQFGVEPPGT